MAEISCKHCGSPDCRGCNIYRLEQMLDAGKLDPLMNENRVIQISADVRPVARGRWIKLDMHSGMEQHKCSVCNQECYVPTCMGEPMYNYCPNCGAQMDAGVREVDDG